MPYIPLAGHTEKLIRVGLGSLFNQTETALNHIGLVEVVTFQPG